MYELLRNDVISGLSGVVSRDVLGSVLNVLDSAADKYTIEKKSMQLAIVGRKQILDTIKLYFIVRLQEGISKETYRVQNYILNKFAMQCTVPMCSVSANTIRSYLYNYQQQKNIGYRTMQLYRSVLCTFFKWCHAQGYIPTDVTSVIRKIQYQHKTRKALSQMQLQDVRGACTTPLEKALVQMLYSTGCRISQLVNIKQSDIDWIKKEVVVTGKGNKTRTVYINAKAQKAIKKYLDESGNKNGTWLLTNLRGNGKLSKESAERVFRKIRSRLGLQPDQLVPHTMRHTMATQAATLCPIQQVQVMLGHSSINTTMVYAETSKQQVKAGHTLSVI